MSKQSEETQRKDKLIKIEIKNTITEIKSKIGMD